MKYYLKIFIIYSILGFILETTIKTIFHSNMINGILNGPWIPIYGIGVCIIISIMRLIFNRIEVNKIIKVILLFLISTIVLTLLEYITGNLIAYTTGKILWDYEQLKFHYGHFISLEISLIWGVMSLIVTYIIKPIIDKFIDKIPDYIIYITSSIYLIDIIITLIY